MDARQAAVTCGQSFNLASQLITSDPSYEYRGQATLGDLVVAADEIFKVLALAQEEAPEAYQALTAQTRVETAFPGTSVVNHVQEAPVAPAPYQQPVQDNVVPFPAAPQQYAQPAPIPGAVDGDPATDALWRQFAQDPKRWWDNRFNKRNPKAPDFKHKDTGEGLWLVGKKNPSYVNPNWVTGILQGA